MGALLLSLITVALCIIQLLRTRYRKHLSSIPGPLFASISSAWKIKAVYDSIIHRRYIEVHQKYGSVVRIGPNHVSVSSPQGLQQIYLGKIAFAKSDFYKPTSFYYQGHILPNLFSIQDIEQHASLKKLMAGLYSKSAAAGLEGHVDDCVGLMIKRFADREDATPVDMAKWLHFYAFDSLCAVSMSRTLGFLDMGSDTNGLIARGDTYMHILGFCSQAPWFQHVNNLMAWANRSDPILAFIERILDERSEGTGIIPTNDMLGSLLGLQQKNPDRITKREVIAAAFVNLIAGQDLVANALRTVFYYLARMPDKAQKLQAEIQQTSCGLDMSTLIPYSDLLALPYLEAVMYESFRIHGNTGMMLERVVPEGGTVIDHHFLPGGTIVGCNSWVVHRNTGIFGSDVEEFRPERWLVGDEQQTALMKRNLFSFGAGSRMCIGRNIAWLQMLKLIAEFYRRFDVSLARPEKEWRVAGNWITTQTEMDMVVRQKGCDLVMDRTKWTDLRP